MASLRAPFIPKLESLGFSGNFYKDNFLFDKSSNRIFDFDELINMLKQWCVTTPSNKKYFMEVLDKINRLKREMNKPSFKFQILKYVMVVSLLAAYISSLINKETKVETIGWFSDRDSIFNFHDKLASDLYDINFHLFNTLNGLEEQKMDIIIGVPEDSGKMWYDEMNRLPDYITGTLADWDLINNKTTKSKFNQVIEEVIANNNKVLIFKLQLTERLFSCSRILTEKATS